MVCTASLMPEGFTAVAAAACSLIQLGQDWDRQRLKPIAATRFTRSTFKVSKLIDKLTRKLQSFIKKFISQYSHIR